MNKLCFIIMILSVALVGCVHMLRIYQESIAHLTWANDTLYLNVVANRESWKVCKRYRICDRTQDRMAVRDWDVVRIGEAQFRP